MNHKKLIKMAREFGYKSINRDGLCQGFAMMWVQAVCAGELDIFKERLELLDTFKSSPKELLFILEQLKNEIKNNYQNVKYKPTEDEYILLEIPAFFEGVLLYLLPEQHRTVFANETVCQSDIELISKYVAVKNIKRTFFTTDQYTREELAQFLEKLELKLDGRSDVALHFQILNHAVSARYLGKGLFEYIDINTKTNKDIKHWVGDAKGMAEQLFSSMFSENEKSLSLATNIFIPEHALKIDFEACRNKEPLSKLYNNSKGFTVLHLAGKLNDMALVCRIDFNKVDLNQATMNGYNALQFAYLNSSMDVLKFFLQQEQTHFEKKTNSRISLERNVLLHLFLHEKFDKVFDLIRNTRLEFFEVLPQYLLGDLVYEGSNKAVSAVSQLLKKYKVSQEEKTELLIIACAKDNKDMAKLLLANGADIEQENNSGLNAFYFVVKYGNMSILELLDKYKPDYNKRNKQNATVFDLALQFGHMDMVKKLLPLTTMDAQYFGMHWALTSINCNFEMKKEILKKGLFDYIKQMEFGSHVNSLGFFSKAEEKIAAAKALELFLEDPQVDLSPHKSVLVHTPLANIFCQCVNVIKQHIQNVEISKNKVGSGAIDKRFQ